MMTIPRSMPVRYGIVLLSIVAALSIELLLPSIFTNVPYVLFYAAVMVSAWYGGLVPGLLAAVLTILLVDYFFLPPVHSIDFGLTAATRLGPIMIAALLAGALSLIRRRSEAALRRSEEQYRRIVDTASEGIVTIDGEGRITFANERMATMLGSTEHELIGRSFYELFEPSQIAKLRENIEGNRAQGEERDFCLRRADGSTFWGSLSVNAMYSPHGEFSGALTMVADITAQKRASEELEERVRQRTAELAQTNDALRVEVLERKRSQEELRHSTEFSEMLISSSLDGILAFDRDFRYTVWNPAMERISGVSAAQAVGSDAFELFPFLREIGEEEYWHDALQGKTVIARDRKFVIPSTGREGYFEGHYAPLRNKSGEIVGGIGIIRDITERKNAEHALIQSEEYFRRVTENALDIIAILEIDGTIRYESPSLERVLGYKPEEVIGTNAFLLIHPDDLPGVIEIFNDAVNMPGATRQAEFRYLHKNGSWRFLESIGKNLLHDPAVAGVVLNSRDITARKNAEQAVRESEERYRSVIAALDEGIVLQDSEGIVRTCNASMERILGIDADALIGAPMPGPHLIMLAEDGSHFPAEKYPALATLRTGEPQSAVVIGIHRSDDSLVWLSVTSQPLRREGEETPYAVVTSFVDITERRRAEEERAQLIREQAMRAAVEVEQRQLAFLAEASSVLGASLDFETTLGSLAHLAVTSIGDWCLIDVLDERSEIHRIATAHADPSREAIVRKLRRYPPDPSKIEGVPKVLQTGRAEIVTDITDAWLSAAVHDEEHFKIIRELGAVSLMYVPLAAHGQMLGAITLALSDPRRQYGPGDLTLAQELARRAALAIENSRLYQNTERAVRRERRRATQLRGLSEASLAIHSALALDDVLRITTEKARDLIGAHQAITTLTFDEAWSHPMNAVSFSDKYGVWRGYTGPTVVNGICGLVCETNRPMRMTQEELEERFGPDGGSESLHPPLRGWLAAPLATRDGRNLGLIQLSDRYEGEFSEEDEAVLAQLAQIASSAIENVRLYNEAQEANRAKDEFLATVSHEVRTPLNAILGWAQMLQSGELDSETSAQAIEAIERNARAQARIIEDILEVSRIIAGKLHLDLRALDIADVVRAAVDSLLPAADEKSVDVALYLCQDHCAVQGDPNRLQQVIWNLLANAIKFTPIGGNVAVRLERVEGSARITVSDTGAGIKPDFLPFVFDRFKQADGTISRSHGGLGLGLAIVRNIVEMHGGEVRADSPGEGMGAIFTIHLPLLSPGISNGAGSPVAEPSESDLALIVLDGLRILVVDDEPDARQLVTTILSRRGAEIRACASAMEAFETLAEWKPDLLVSDIGMPGEDGYSLIGRVRKLDPEQGGRIPAVALTAYARSEDRMKVLDAGFQMHVPKPVEPIDLVNAITDLVRSTAVRRHLPT